MQSKRQQKQQLLTYLLDHDEDFHGQFFLAETLDHDEVHHDATPVTPHKGFI